MKYIFPAVVFLFVIVTSCLAGGMKPVRELLRDPGAIEGSFTVILIGGNYTDDPNRMAILDRNDDGYGFRPVMPDYLVKRIAGLTRGGALAEAEKFFSVHCAYNGYKVGSLTLKGKGVIGYEVVPDYPSALCEYGNEINISYGNADKDGTIKVYTAVLFDENTGKSERSSFKEMMK